MHTDTTDPTAVGVDREALDRHIAEMYRDVANEADRDLHFPTGRPLAEALGYPADLLDRLPARAVTRSPAWATTSASRACSRTSVCSISAAAPAWTCSPPRRRLARAAASPGWTSRPSNSPRPTRLRRDTHVSFRRARIEELPFDDGSFDAVISNGVINLSADKRRAFAEAARVLRPGGRLALADIVTERQIAARTACQADLWAACIAGASQSDLYLEDIASAGLELQVDPREPGLPLHQRAGAAHERQIRRSQRLTARAQARPCSPPPLRHHNDPGGLEMSAVTDTIRNGVDTEQMFATLDLIKAQPELAKFQFRATNRWIDGAHNRSTIKGFYAAGGEDTTRSEEFQIDAGEPAILLGTDTGPNPAEYLLHALAACLTTTIVYVAAARKVELTSVESTLTGDMDVRGALGVDDEPRNGFERIGVSFRVTGNAPEEKLREVVERAQKRSAVYDMVTNGVPVAIEVTTD